MISHDWKLGALGSSILSALMLAYAVWGSPPYAYFGIMKLVVTASLAICAYVLFEVSKKFIALSLILTVLAMVQFTGNMRRADWAKFDEAAMAGLGLTAVMLITSLIKKPRRCIRNLGDVAAVLFQKQRQH